MAWQLANSVVRLLNCFHWETERESERERERVAKGWAGGGIELTLEIKLAECDHVRRRAGDRACSPDNRGCIFPYASNNIEENFSSFDGIDLVVINARNVISGMHVMTNRG